jgi:hypothetical protein
MSGIIPVKDVGAAFLKILEDVVSDYPTSEQDRLKSVILEQLSIAMFNEQEVKNEIRNATF